METIKMSAEDKQLEEMLHGVEKPLHPETIHKTISMPAHPAKSKKNQDNKEHVKEKKMAQKPTGNQMDAEYEPVKTWYDEKTVNMVKCVVIFIALEYLFFYWQQTGQMQPSAAMPSMIVCALLAGVSIGKNLKWGN